MNNLAVFYKCQERCAEAAPLYQRALAIFERSLRPSDAGVITCRKNYAALLRAQTRGSGDCPKDTLTTSDPRSGARVAIRLDSQNGVLIILTVILAHVAFLVVVLPHDGLGDPLTRANARLNRGA